MNGRTGYMSLALLLVGCGGSMVTTAPSGEAVDVAAASFKLGAEGKLDNPLRTAQLGAFQMDKYEVTNGEYRACVQAGGCTEPGAYGFDTAPTYYTGSDFDSHPVVFVDWYQANAYCEWQGKRLPTEAEWEAAARGTDGRTYPWGEAAPDCTRAQYGDCTDAGGTANPLAVGSLPDGQSPSGALDMSGNVAEWVADWYDARASQLWEDGQQPVSPANGRLKSVRGGSWWCATDRLSAYRREPLSPNYRAGNIGFRCVR